MDFQGEKLVHKKWGEGIVVRHQHPYFVIQFSDGQHTLLFPNAFTEATVFSDSQVQKQLRNMIAEKEWTDMKTRAQWGTHSPSQPTSTVRKAPSARYNKDNRSNIAFKCNYCDGGSNKYHIGYMGVCSDRMIRYNIQEARHSWCSDVTCPCSQYLRGEIDGYQLDELCRDGGFVCYESQMLREWTAFAGFVLQGDRKEEPKKIRNIQMNSLAVLTTRMPDMSEEDRFVFGVFLVDDGDEGNGNNEGFVRSNSQYRIEMSPAEAMQIKFWNYHANENKPEKAVWSQGLHRYMSDIEAAQLLRDIANVKRIPAEKKFAEEFFTYFCKIQKINVEMLPEPNGALRR